MLLLILLCILIAGVLATYRYPWTVPQSLSNYLHILKDNCAPVLEWSLHNPPKPHAFTSLPLLSVSEYLYRLCRRLEITVYNIGSGQQMLDAANNDAALVSARANQKLANINALRNRILNRVRMEMRQPGVQPETAREYRSIVHSTNITAARGRITISEGVTAVYHQLAILPFVVMEFPLIESVLLSLAIMFDSSLAYCIALVQPVLQVYRLYKLPSRIILIYSLVIKLYNYTKKSDVISYCMVAVYMIVISFLFTIANEFICDAPRVWGLYFQDGASPIMEALVELHVNIMYYFVTILYSVGWIVMEILLSLIYKDIHVLI